MDWMHIHRYPLYSFVLCILMYTGNCSYHGFYPYTQLRSDMDFSHKVEGLTGEKNSFLIIIVQLPVLYTALTHITVISNVTYMASTLSRHSAVAPHSSYVIIITVSTGN